jgi:hypothetical protein
LAIWQFRAWLVPGPQLPLSEGVRVAGEILESTSVAWAGVAPELLSQKVAQLGLPKTESWNPTAMLWGREDGSYLRALVKGTEIREVEVGIDARSVDRVYFDRLSKLLDELGAVLVTANGVVVDGSPRGIAEALRGSRAWAFVADPRGFLDSLGTAVG